MASSSPCRDVATRHRRSDSTGPTSKQTRLHQRQNRTLLESLFLQTFLLAWLSIKDQLEKQLLKFTLTYSFHPNSSKTSSPPRRPAPSVATFTSRETLCQLWHSSAPVALICSNTASNARHLLLERPRRAAPAPASHLRIAQPTSILATDFTGLGNRPAEHCSIYSPYARS